jgi:hypothetical protein
MSASSRPSSANWTLMAFSAANLRTKAAHIFAFVIVTGWRKRGRGSGSVSV